MKAIREFLAVYAMYRHHHSATYAMRRAYEMAFLRYPF